MPNPWEEINLSDYENHMSLDSVKQLQVMNEMMKEQFDSYQTKTMMLLGIAGGNGLEHISPKKYKRIYGVDINADYLKTVSERYDQLKGVLKCLHLNLIEEAEKLPHADFVIANLLVEYIGYDAFMKVINQVGPKYISCIIQINASNEQWISDSPYLRVFDRLDEVHHQMSAEKLTKAMCQIAYRQSYLTSYELPNNKRLVRIDYCKNI